MIQHSGDANSKVAGALIGLAVGDALGAPVEFQERGSFPLVTEMRAGGYFRLPAGAWTDDTAMALCLADSLIAHPAFDPADMLNRFLRWMNDHENTSTGRCIGVGQNTKLWVRTMSHYPATLLGLLPLKNWLCCINFRIVNIAHAESMKYILFHTVSIAQ